MSLGPRKNLENAEFSGFFRYTSGFRTFPENGEKTHESVCYY
nr:MAG TPA: hypothetical protein [Bacteriophage sp.]